ncbi:ketopantoate reductase family protein [Elioraea sp.]|uniref:ketopantoate reductase family protein n=1 Tax=Elioraea sp. TaxID=2185103 RepID=UPI003F725337
MTDGPVLIWGAGAIGGTIGAFLVRQGHDVAFVDVDAAHVGAIAAGRLSIEGPVARFAVGAPAFTPDTARGQFRRVILAVKAHHTATAIRQLAPHLADDGAVVSAQNGLNEIEIAAVVGRERTIGAFVNFGADWQAPGEILYANRGAVVIGELDGTRTARIEAWHALLQDFEPDAELTGDIFAYLWGKTGYGALLKASAVADMTIAGFIGDPTLRTLNVALVREVLAVASAEGVTPRGFNGFEPAPFARNDAAGIDASIATMVAFNEGTAKPYSGVWRDLAVRKRPTDSAAQLAPVLRAAKGHGIATPTLDRLVALIGAVERGGQSIGRVLAEDLRAVAEGRSA